MYLAGFLCAASERWAEALILWAAADTESAKRGFPHPTEDVYRPRRSEYAGQIDQALSPAQIREARERGNRMPARAALELIGVVTEPVSPENGDEGVDGTLSSREQELITLVAQGATNAQIAAKLNISVYTVRSHLDRIRDKTGCRRRADLTRLAIRRGLI